VSIAFAGVLKQEPESETRRRSRRILVVDDEEMVRVFAAMALEDEGYEVVQAADATEAAYLWSRENGCFDLLFTDISLPGQTGVELAESLRSLDPDLNVIFASGHDESEFSRPVDATSKDIGFLPKPYSVKTLLDAVRRALPKSASPPL
jgi:two-component system, cell cycle sensor histidine kinase and response regulator CckA